MNVSIDKGETIALFAILFIIVGALTPIVYIEVAPQGDFIEVHNFTADDTHASADKHNIHFDRTVYRPTDVEITVEMVLVRGDGSVVETDSYTVDAYYQEGRQNVTIPRQIRVDRLEPGEYKYLHAVELEYYNGFAERHFVFESETFTVYEDEAQITERLK